MNTVICSGCGTEVELLDLFPRNRCLSCHARAFDLAERLGVQHTTADDIVRMWDGK